MSGEPDHRDQHQPTEHRPVRVVAVAGAEPGAQHGDDTGDQQHIVFGGTKILQVIPDLDLDPEPYNLNPKP